MNRKYLYFVLALLILAWGCHRRPSLQFGAYSEAERHYEKGRYEKAIQKYQEYIRENPQGNMTVICLYYMAKSHEALGQRDQARELYQKIVREHKGLIWVDFSKDRLKELHSPSRS